MTAVKKRAAAKAKKMQPPKKPRQKVKVVYVKEKEPETGMGDLTHMAMDGAVFAGSLGLMTTMGGLMSTATNKP